MPFIMTVTVVINDIIHPMGANNSYGVDDIERTLGVRARTIHFWVQSGLLDGPGAGRGARYTDQHLGKLFMIQKLRAERRPLREIAAAVKQISPAQLAVLAEQANAARRTPKARANELIGRWLEAISPRESSQDQSAGESWTRVSLRDGVELHVRHRLSPESKALVDALLALT